MNGPVAKPLSSLTKPPFRWDRFSAVPIVGILRGFERGSLRGIVRAAIAGGLTTLEVTMNTPGATDQIREIVDLSEGALSVGAGTVLDLPALRRALSAGAAFIVTPTLQRGVVQACAQEEIPVFPGVLSLSEALLASDLGARWIKLFPADALDAGYFMSLKEECPVQLLATGGVTLESLPRLRTAGADGFGIGSPLFSPDRIRNKDWDWLERRCRDFTRPFQAGNDATSNVA